MPHDATRQGSYTQAPASEAAPEAEAMTTHAAAIRIILDDLHKMRQVKIDEWATTEFGGRPQIDLRLRVWYEAKAWAGTGR